MAFVGGIDLALMRYDDSKHQLSDSAGLWRYNDYQNIRVVDFKSVELNEKDVVDRRNVPRQPWRDIACQVTGAVATDVGRHFIERWSHARRLQGGARYYDIDTAIELQAPDRQIILSRVEKANEKAEEAVAVAKAVTTRGEKVRISSSVVLKELESCIPKAVSLAMPLSSAQVLRSVSRWSAGTRHESSIHSAYCNLIENAENFVYIENQFFASATVEGDSNMGNRIASALLTRLLKAVRSKQKFRVVVVMPLFPGFAGEVENDTGNSGPLLTVMHWQYRTICRGNNSIFSQLQKAIQESGSDKEPSDFIQFLSLRTWAVMGGGGGGERLVTENVYVHSKALIVDDVSVVVGSANINDRSMLGNRDSEMCMLMEDETKVFGRSMREASMMEFFGESSNKSQYINWMDDQVWFNMAKRAKENTEAYREVMHPLPDDTLTTWSQVKKMRASRTFDTDKYAPDQMKAPVGDAAAVRTMRERVKGIVVEFPLDFLKDENLVEWMSMGGLAPSIFN